MPLNSEVQDSPLSQDLLRESARIAEQRGITDQEALSLVIHRQSNELQSHKHVQKVQEMI